MATVSLIDPTTLNPSFANNDNRIGRPAVILTRADQQTSVDQFQQLLVHAKQYRLQMLALSKAAASFGYSLEKIAHAKTAAMETEGSTTHVGSSLQAAAGLHYLMSNHHQVLSDTLYKQFEIPLLQHLDTHKVNIEASEAQYEKSMRDMSKKIRDTEAANLQNGRKRQRDLLQFRQALTTLTQQVDELERIKLEYYFSNLESEQANLQLILQKTSTIVRAEVDIYERISSKGLNDPLLEAMTTHGHDPYCVYPTTDEFSSIFSILPPTPIITTGGSGTPSQIDSNATNNNGSNAVPSFYNYHEANPFSVTRTSNNTSHNRHLFGEASSAESSPSMMNHAANNSNTSSAANIKLEAEASNPFASMPTTAKMNPILSSNMSSSSSQSITSPKNSISPLETSTLQRSMSNASNSAHQALSPVREVADQEGGAQTNSSSKVGRSETSKGIRRKQSLKKESVSNITTITPLAPAPSTEGQQEQRDQLLETPVEQVQGSEPGADYFQTAAGANGTETSNDRQDVASSPQSSQASSSMPGSSSIFRSRSGSRSHHQGGMMATTPESIKVRVPIHISQDSELLNNRDFSFSYDPTDILKQPSSSTSNSLHLHQDVEFNGFEELDERHILNGFNGMTDSPPASSSSNPTTQSSSDSSLASKSGPEPEQTTTLNGHDHSNGTNKESPPNSLPNGAQHKTIFQISQKTGTSRNSSLTSLGLFRALRGSNGNDHRQQRQSDDDEDADPYLDSVRQQEHVDDHMRDLGRGFDDGIPAFFVDDENNPHGEMNGQEENGNRSDGENSGTMSSRTSMFFNQGSKGLRSSVSIGDFSSATATAVGDKIVGSLGVNGYHNPSVISLS